MMDLMVCPFCGGGAKVVHETTELNGHRYWHIEHFARHNECVLVNAFGRFASGSYTTEEKLIDAWNRRYLKCKN